MKTKDPIQLNSHVYRLFKIFDELYEFGATDYFVKYKGIEFGYDLFNQVLKDLDHKTIQVGIDRISSLKYRKRVFPEPKVFYRICVMSDEKFLEQTPLYEYRIYEYKAR